MNTERYSRIRDTITQLISGIKEKNYDKIEKNTINRPLFWKLGLAKTDIRELSYNILNLDYNNNSAFATLKLKGSFEVLGDEYYINNKTIKLKLNNINGKWKVDLSSTDRSILLI
ncbi:hypothetical protein [Halothermothrix orenii]|uniref:Uncharacterized protein n=1 Tax=Halothermothrix orenii (strain H 168 / OCM 544 / DSM 9562) TaxID=373903 RepID=B8CX31_HALOH|nr:hypothetical protein [Halothermothrix orenii]ACL69850.1 hypothetical protein Hore_10960 [Halothermothrix orenii H 168]